MSQDALPMFSEQLTAINAAGLAALAAALAAALLSGLVVGLWMRARRAAESATREAAMQQMQGKLDEQQKALVSAQDSLAQHKQALQQGQTKLAVAEAQRHELLRRVRELNGELDSRRDEIDELNSARTELAEQLARATTREQAQARHMAEQLAQLEQNKQVLKQEFENLAQQIFEAKGKAFSEQNRQSLDALLNPFKQQIGEFKDKVDKVHLEGTKQQAELRTELKQLQDMHQKMSQEAHDLATALKGQKKMQGNWGELVLENVLDRSGLILGSDYQREVSFNKEDGGRARPDALVYLPQGKHLIIDAKVSLNAYTRYVNSEDEQERAQALKEHVEAMRARIKELADRDYYKLAGVNSPDMVFMFVPIESAFVEALKADEDLFQQAIAQNVLVATPTTLLTSLNIVRQLWRFENQNKHTAELVRRADGVFKKLKTFLQSFEGVRKGLDSAQEAYNKAEKQLVHGKGNLVKQVADFKQLAPAIKDQLPEYFTEKAALELDLDPEPAAQEKAVEIKAIAPAESIE